MSPSAGTAVLPLAFMPGLALANSPQAAQYHRLVTLALFGFINIGVSLMDLHASMLLAPVLPGIILALRVGKPAGVFGATMLAVRLKLSPPTLTACSQLPRASFMRAR
ncbi:Na+/H+ antiporter NhaA [Komagataeibacter intermedius]|nr:Na+/H+ antiporter NhaA [Komagataeibacter intermedius]MCF3635905.1 Na+/H+ antiporter NhaA [Komagataeibacter intermedius]